MRRRDWWPLAVLLTACAIIGILAAVAFLIGCAEPNRLEEGRVLERSYDDPDTWTETDSYCMARSSNGWCTMTGYSSYERHDGPHWHLKVVGFDKDGKERTETHEVTETLYQLGQVGVVVNFAENRVVPK